MPRILVVDDSADQLELRALILEGDGHTVTGAASPEEALAALPGHDAVIMDLRLPAARDGRHLIAGLHAAAPATPIIVLSGFPQDLAGHPEAALVRQVLVKPFPSGRLAGILRSVLAP